jgi:D-alanyl-D-alanine carboxypeptidase
VPLVAIDVDACAARVRVHLERVASRLPGVQYAMTDANTTRFEFCGGLADVGARRAIDRDTLFMAASCTKVVTATAVLALAEAGRVGLDASLSDSYPDHPYGREVTIRQLLAHTAGVPNPLPVNWLHRIDDAAFDEDRALAAVLRAHPRLRSAPGVRYAYSNLGYWLLGKVIERASGSRYVRHVEDAVLAPLAVPRGELCFTIENQAILARGYQRAWSALGMFTRMAVRKSLRDGRDGEWLRFARVYMDGPAYGGLFATARGFCSFLRSQLSRVPSPALGWRTGDVTSVAYLGKPGGGPGFCGNVRVYPSIGIATAWFANHMEVSERKIIAFTDAIDRNWLDGRTSD